MPKAKSYRVVRAVSSADKDGHAIHVTRDNEHQIADLLTAKRIAELVETGVLEEHEVDAAGHVPSDAVTAAPTPRK